MNTMLTMLGDALSTRDPSLKSELDQRREDFLQPDGYVMGGNNRGTKIRVGHEHLRDWLFQCLCGIPDPEVMDLNAWGAQADAPILAPFVDEGKLGYVFPEKAKDNNLIPDNLREFLKWGFIFFDANKHKITKDEVIVPKTDYRLENAFGPLFMDFLWNGFFMRCNKLDRIMPFLLALDVETFHCMGYLSKVEVISAESAAAEEEEQDEYVFSASLMATMIWCFEVAVDADYDNARCDAKLRRQKIFLEFNTPVTDDNGEPRQNPFEEKFMLRTRELITLKKLELKNADRLAVGDVAVERRFRPSFMKSKVRIVPSL